MNAFTGIAIVASDVMKDSDKAIFDGKKLHLSPSMYAAVVEADPKDLAAVLAKVQILDVSKIAAAMADVANLPMFTRPPDLFERKISIPVQMHFGGFLSRPNFV